jgi:hypothetical protein
MAERRESGSDSSEEETPTRDGETPTRDEETPTRGTAPSAANIEDLEKFEASEEAKAHEPSTVDARGQDKRRQVVGHSYGPSAKSQIMFFVAVAAVVVVVVGGWLGLVALFDTPPTHFKDQAPWSKTAANSSLAAQQNAKPVDPADPCGEPGNPYPIPAESPCATPSKANGFQGGSSGD